MFRVGLKACVGCGGGGLVGGEDCSGVAWRVYGVSVIHTTRDAAVMRQSFATVARWGVGAGHCTGEDA